MSFAPYQRAVGCSNGPQPGALAFLKAVLSLGTYSRAKNLGCFNCRRARGSNTSWSLHAEGRADDLQFPRNDPQGDALVKEIVAKAGQLGVQAVIWRRRFYSAASPAGRHYDGPDPHDTHVHIEFSWSAAKNLTVAKVLAILGGKAAARPAAAIDDHGPVGRFPLQAGHWYGANETSKGHSGDKPGDRLAIKAIQREVGVTPDGRFGKDTLAAVRAWQRRYRLDDDGACGVVTWDRMRVA